MDLKRKLRRIAAAVVGAYALTAIAGWAALGSGDDE